MLSSEDTCSIKFKMLSSVNNMQCFLSSIDSTYCALFSSHNISMNLLSIFTNSYYVIFSRYGSWSILFKRDINSFPIHLLFLRSTLLKFTILSKKGRHNSLWSNVKIIKSNRVRPVRIRWPDNANLLFFEMCCKTHLLTNKCKPQ